MPRRAVPTKVYERYVGGAIEYVAFAPSYNLQAVGFSEEDALQTLQLELNDLRSAVRDGRTLHVTYEEGWYPREAEGLPPEAGMVTMEMITELFPSAVGSPELRESRELSEARWIGGAGGMALGVGGVGTVTGGTSTMAVAVGGTTNLSTGGTGTAGAGGVVTIPGGPRNVSRDQWDEQRNEELRHMCMAMATAMLPGKPQHEIVTQARLFMQLPDEAIRASCHGLAVSFTETATVNPPVSRFNLMDGID